MRTNMILAGIFFAVLSGCVPSRQAQSVDDCFDAYNVPVTCSSASIPPLPEGGQGGVGASAAATDGTCAADCASDPSSRVCKECQRNQLLQGENEGLRLKLQKQESGQPTVIASEAAEQSVPPPLQGGDRGGLILPALIGGIQETSARFEAYTYLPPGYERSHRFSVEHVAGADAIVCMFRDGTQLNIRGTPDAIVGWNGDPKVPPALPVIVGEYSYLSGKQIGCTRASSTLFDPTGCKGEFATLLILTPVVGQGIAVGTGTVRVWQVSGRFKYRYPSRAVFHTITRGEIEGLSRSL